MLSAFFDPPMCEHKVTLTHIRHSETHCAWIGLLFGYAVIRGQAKPLCVELVLSFKPLCVHRWLGPCAVGLMVLCVQQQLVAPQWN